MVAQRLRIDTDGFRDLDARVVAGCGHAVDPALLGYGKSFAGHVMSSQSSALQGAAILLVLVMDLRDAFEPSAVRLDRINRMEKLKRRHWCAKRLEAQHPAHERGLAVFVPQRDRKFDPALVVEEQIGIGASDQDFVAQFANELTIEFAVELMIYVALLGIVEPAFQLLHYICIKQGIKGKDAWETQIFLYKGCDVGC